MKINSCVFIAMATALSLMAGFTDAKRDRREPMVAAEAAVANLNQNNVAAAASGDATIDSNELWKHKQKQNGKHHHH
ncbi:hypothetical protein BGZ97_012334, partial [Linnemannia gamsii]